MDRRPLNSRTSFWSRYLLSLLLRTKITPDQISLLGLVFAALAGMAAAFFRIAPPVLLPAAAVLIQLRLLCNLLDGMVAIEGGRSSKYGELYNELPDRAADTLIILGVGCGYAGTSAFGVSIIDWAWAAALLALATAYVRCFGASLSGVHDFLGPMAKPHRMALLTMALLLEAVLVVKHAGFSVIPPAFVLLNLGLLVTLYRRIRLVVARLQ